MKKKIIRIDPVEQYLYAYIGSEKNFMDYIHEDFEKIENISDTWEGFHAFHSLKDGELSHVIWVKRKDLGLIVHEIAHCVETVMDLSGIHDEEFRAYMSQHLFYEIKNDLKYNKSGRIVSR